MYRIYILSHNRPHSILQCIKSVERAAKGIRDVEIIISENSPNANVINFLGNENIKSSIKKRKYYMSGIDHINFCLNEAKVDKKKYVCIFHDDDLMEENFVKKTITAFKDNPSAAAVAFDISIRNKYKKVRTFNKNDVANSIFSVNSNYIIPFPSYTYNLNLIKNEELNRNIGKHCDAEFILRVADQGEILIIGSLQMKSIVHPGSDSYIESISLRRLLINELMLSHNFKKINFKNYRMAYILRKKGLNNLSFLFSPKKRYIYIYLSYLCAKLSFLKEKSYISRE